MPHPRSCARTKKQCRDQAQRGSEKAFFIYLLQENCQSESKEHLYVVDSQHCRIFGCISALFQTSLFGEGTYLTSDLSLALLYSPHGLGWQRSALGSVLSCVAVCEIIDHPDVKCQVKKKGESIARITSYSTSFLLIYQLCAYTLLYKERRMWGVDTCQQKLTAGSSFYDSVIPFPIDPSTNAQQPCCL